jgi:hypothetical protein
MLDLDNYTYAQSLVSLDCVCWFLITPLARALQSGTDWTVYATSSSRVITGKLLKRDVPLVLHFIVDADL